MNVLNLNFDDSAVIIVLDNIVTASYKHDSLTVIMVGNTELNWTGKQAETIFNAINETLSR